MNNNSIVAITTAKETYENYVSFITENLKRGVDYFFIFFEGELNSKLIEQFAGVVKFISSKEVNPFEMNLNRRQIKNLNTIRKSLLEINYEGWIVNIDSDEFLQIDKKRINKLTLSSINLSVIEPVIDTKELYKKVLSKKELRLAYSLGYIEKEDNFCWLNGHIAGKYMTRVNSSHWTVHEITNVELYNDDFAQIIHKDCHTVEEFKEKFLRHSYTHAGYNDFRRLIVETFKNYRDEVFFPLIVDKLFENHFKKDSLKDLELKKDLGFYFNLPVHRNDEYIVNFPDDFDLIINKFIQDGSINVDNMEYGDMKNSLIIDAVRDRAIELESIDIEKSFYLMSNVLKARPNGSFIKKKVNEYKKKLKL